MLWVVTELDDIPMAVTLFQQMVVDASSHFSHMSNWGLRPAKPHENRSLWKGWERRGRSVIGAVEAVAQV